MPLRPSLVVFAAALLSLMISSLVVAVPEQHSLETNDGLQQPNERADGTCPFHHQHDHDHHHRHHHEHHHDIVTEGDEHIHHSSGEDEECPFHSHHHDQDHDHDHHHEETGSFTAALDDDWVGQYTDSQGTVRTIPAAHQNTETGVYLATPFNLPSLLANVAASESAKINPMLLLLLVNPAEGYSQDMIDRFAQTAKSITKSTKMKMSHIVKFAIMDAARAPKREGWEETKQWLLRGIQSGCAQEPEAQTCNGTTAEEMAERFFIDLPSLLRVSATTEATTLLPSSSVTIRPWNGTFSTDAVWRHLVGDEDASAEEIEDGQQPKKDNDSLNQTGADAWVFERGFLVV